MVGDRTLKDGYRIIFRLTVNKELTTLDTYDLLGGTIVWSIVFKKALRDRESDLYVELLELLNDTWRPFR